MDLERRGEGDDRADAGRSPLSQPKRAYILVFRQADCAHQTKRLPVPVRRAVEIQLILDDQGLRRLPVQLEPDDSCMFVCLARSPGINLGLLFKFLQASCPVTSDTPNQVVQLLFWTLVREYASKGTA